MKRTTRLLMAVMLLALPFSTFAQEQDLDAKYATEMLRPGTIAPAITDGSVNLIEKNKGKYVVLEFWASWCGDCRADMKHMREINSKYCCDSIMIQGYSFDKTEEAFRKCVNDSALVWPQAMSQVPMRNSDVAKEYHIKWIPSYYVIDKEGRVALATVMVDKIEKFLQHLKEIF